jgi:hypothetical protein
MSIYHGLQTQLVTRFGHGSQASVAYTWSKSLANTGLANADGSALSVLNTSTDQTNIDLDYGRSAVDKTHLFSGSVILQGPAFDDKSGAAKAILGGWQVTGIVQASSGYPITVFVGGVPGLSGNGNISGTGFNGNQRPDRVEGQPCRATGGPETQWLNPAAWTLNGHVIGTNGNSGRHICDGPGFFQLDAAVYKNFKVGKRVQLQLRAEMFNVTNRTNFLVGSNVSMYWNPQSVTFDTGNAATATRITNSVPAGNFGQLSDSADPRQMQFGVRLSF